MKKPFGQPSPVKNWIRNEAGVYECKKYNKTVAQVKIEKKQQWVYIVFLPNGNTASGVKSSCNVAQRCAEVYL